MHVRGSKVGLVVSFLAIALVISPTMSTRAQAPANKGPGFQPKAPGFQPKAPGFQPKAPVPPPKAATPPPPQKKGPKLPEPEDVALETKDGVSIKATYYPGTAKKESVPIIMIHGYEGQRGDYHALALYMQGLGKGSIVYDIRGNVVRKLQ